MNFCIKCNNMYYLSVPKDDDTLVYSCKNCGHTDTALSATNTNILNSHLSTNPMNANINEYTKYDPTLPQIDTIDCPNSECLSNSNNKEEKKKKKILYMRYDDAAMKYVYLCCVCDETWRIQV